MSGHALDAAAAAQGGAGRDGDVALDRTGDRQSALLDLRIAGVAVGVGKSQLAQADLREAAAAGDHSADGAIVAGIVLNYGRSAGQGDAACDAAGVFQRAAGELEVHAADRMVVQIERSTGEGEQPGGAGADVSAGNADRTAGLVERPSPALPITSELAMDNVAVSWTLRTPTALAA